MPSGICYKDSFQILTFLFSYSTPWSTRENTLLFIHLGDKWNIWTNFEELGERAGYAIAFSDWAGPPIRMMHRAAFLIIIIPAFHSKATATITYYQEEVHPCPLTKEGTYSQVYVASVVPFHQSFHSDSYSMNQTFKRKTVFYCQHHRCVSHESHILLIGT